MVDKRRGFRWFGTLLRGLLGRVLRRGFFRLALLLFLLVFVLPMAAMRVMATTGNANALLDKIIPQVFDTRVADVSWDRTRTTVSGPSLALTGVITYHDLRVRRHTGATPHPDRAPIDYDFVHIPKIEIVYDFKRLPRLPVALITMEGGLTLHFNIHKGTWLDQDLFRESDGTGEPPSLPQIILGDAAVVNLRADGILLPPEALNADDDWYAFRLDDLRMLPSPQERDLYQIGGVIEGQRFGRYMLGGSVDRNATQVELLFRTARPIRFDREFASVLSPEVRHTVDQFSIDAERTTVQGRLLIEPGRDLQFEADLDARNGTICYAGFPVRVENASADIMVRNNNIYVEASGMRAGASVNVDVRAENVGTNSENMRVDVRIRDLLVDEEFRLALLPARLQPDNMNYATGLPWPEDEFDPRRHVFSPGYPEWEGPPPWEGGVTYPEMSEAFPFIARAFTPMGLADFELRVDREIRGIDPDTRERRADLSTRFKVFIRDATASFTGLPETDTPGFPIPLRNVYGVVEGSTGPNQPARFEIRGYTQEELDNLGAQAAEGRLALDKRGLTGVLESDSERVYIYAVHVHDESAGRRPRLTMQLETEGVDFNRRVQQRLPQRVREVVQPFTPEGRIDIRRAQIIVTPDGSEDVVFEFALEARGLAAQFQFPDAAEPMRFRDVAGSLSVRSRGNIVELTNMRGTLYNSPVLFSLGWRDGTIPSFSMESNDFAIRPELAAVLPPAIAVSLERFQPRGYVRMDIEGRRGTDQPDFTRADITFLAGAGDRSGSVRFDRFPYHITDVRGRLYVTVSPTQTEVWIREFRGRGTEDPVSGQKAEVRINGHVLIPLPPDGDAPPTEDLPPIMDLDIRATRVPIDAALLTALTPMFRDDDAPAGEKPALISFIENLNTRGTVGAVGRFVTNDQGEFDWRFEISLEGASVNFTFFPMPIDSLYGSLILDRREVSLRNVTGRAEGALVTIHEAGFALDRGWWITAGARQMSFHETPTLRRALPERLREMFLKLNPRGTFDVDLELTGLDDYMFYDVALDTYETDVNLGLEFERMTARFDFEGVIEPTGQRQNGKVFVKEIFFKDARFNDVTGSVQHFGDRIEFPNLRGYFYDGWLEARFGMVEDGYSGEVLIRGANLNKLGKTAFPNAGDLMGALDAEVRFHSWLDAQGQIGRGRIDVQPFDRSSPDPERNTCRLAPVPLFNEIFRVTGSEQNFDEGHVYFWLGPDRVTIRQMDFVSNSARVETFGGDDENYIMYGTNQMRMKLFFTLAPRSPIPLPLIQEILDLLKQILFPLYVTGTINAPNVEPFSLSIQELDEAQDEFPRRPRGG